MRRKEAKYWLILLFERLKNAGIITDWGGGARKVLQALRKKGIDISQASFYRYKQRWFESSNKTEKIMREIIKDLVKE